ncbi:MAG: hypothetical protein WA970_11340 [Gammaproteobacteria bacterium]
MKKKRSKSRYRGPELTTKKEIAAQPAREIFDQRACPMEVVGKLGDRGLCGIARVGCGSFLTASIEV